MLMKQSLPLYRGWRSIVFSVAMILMAGAHLRAQNTTGLITISDDKITLSKALKEVARQLHTGVSYDAELFSDRAISLHFTNAPYKEVLRKILEGTGLEGFLTKEGALSLRKLPPRPGGPVKLSGRVMEAGTGAPLTSVTVSVKGT